MSKRTRRMPEYLLPDPTLAAYDHGVGTLRVDGELRGYIASIVGGTHGGPPWPWFVVVWNDGTKELPFEDYGPGWHSVRELDAGYLDYHEPSIRREGRVLGFRTVASTRGLPCRYEFARLPAAAAAAKWAELGLVDEDF